MAKNKNKNSKAKNQARENSKVVTPVVDESTNEVVDTIESNKTEQVVPVAEKKVEDTTKKTKNKVVEVKAKDVDKKEKKKDKKPNKIVKSLKDTGNELKKVTWPKFKDVVKQTGVVLVVVIIFTAVLYGIDMLCHLLTGLLY